MKANQDSPLRLETTNLLDFLQLGKRWFNHHAHLSTDEMLELGLIDEIDRPWVESLKQMREEGDE